MNHSKALAALVAIVVSVLFTGPANDAKATLLLQWDVEELARHADVVVVGQVEETTTAWAQGRPTIYTHARVRVLQVIAGDVKADTVLHVVQLGGEIDGFRQHLGGAPTFKVGEQSVWFLEPRITGSGERVADHWLVTGLFQGKFQIEFDGTVPMVHRAAGAPGAELVIPDGQMRSTDAEIRMSLTELADRVRNGRKEVTK